MVILCKPMHDCTVTSLQMGRNLLINPCNPSFNFHFCNFGCDLAEKTMHHKAKNLNGIHLCFDTESNLLNMNHSEFNYLKNISHSYLREPKCDLSSKQLLQSSLLNGHVCSSCIPQWWAHMDETSDNSYHSSVVNSYACMILQPSKCFCKNKSRRRLCNNITACVKSEDVGRKCPLSAIYTNNFIMASPSIHHKDVKTHVGIKLFAKKYGRSLSPNLELDQKCFLPFKLPSTNICCLNQTSSLVDSIRPYILRKASIDHKNIPTDKLSSDEAEVSDDSKSTYEDITDVEFSELTTESEPESPSKTSIDKSFEFDCTHSPTQILTGNKRPDQSLSVSHQIPPDFKAESNLQLFSCQCQSNVKSSCRLPGNIISDVFSKTDSGSLFSILQMENISPVLVRKKINEDGLLQTCPTVGSFDSTASANCPTVGSFDSTTSASCPTVGSFGSTASANCPAVGSFDSTTSANCPTVGSFDSTASANCPKVGSFDSTTSANCPKVCSFDSTASVNCPKVGSFDSTASANCPKVGSFDSTASANCPKVGSFDSTTNANCPKVGSFDSTTSANCPTVSSFDSTTSANHAVRKRSSTLLHNFLLDLASKPANDSTALCNSMSPSKHTSQFKSSNVHHQISSASSTLSSLACSLSPVTNQLSYASTAASADDNNPVSRTHSCEKSISNSTNASLLTESSVEQAENVNKVHNVSSKMTYQKYDPFLSQASFSDFNSFPNTDMFDDFSSVTCPVTSQIEQGSDQDTQSHLKDQFSSSNFQTFLDPAPESTSFASESFNDLDSLLNTIPINHVTHAQTTLFPGWPESDTSQSSDSMSLSNYFFNKDTVSKPSLLRKLLDKEGSAIQEPDSDTSWILDQISEKTSDLKKPRIHCGSKKIQYSVGKQAKNNKNLIKSVEIPKAKFNPRQMMQFNKYKPQYQKPTRELPLPSSIKAAGTSPSCEPLQQDAVANGLASPENSLEKEWRKRTELRSSDHSANCELPDDLIDMAVECCTPLEMDQTEALISDLNDSCSWEDNLYSLLESSGQDNSSSNSDSESTQQTSEKLVTSKNPTVTSELLSSFFHSKGSFSVPSSAFSTTAESSFLHHTHANKDTPKSSSCQTSLPPKQKIMSHQVSKTNSCGSSVSSLSMPNCTNTAGKMSLLRAAITSDVDKLIEQIPLRKAKKPTCTLHRTTQEEDSDPDILITKVMGMSSLHKHHHKINKVQSARKARPSENISLCKGSQISKTTLNASGNIMSPPSVQTFTSSVPRKSCDKWQLLKSSPSCEHCGNTSKIQPIINPLVIKINISSSSTPTVICSNKGSQNNLSQLIKPNSQNKVFDKSPNPSFSRAQKFPSTDLSSTQPVSVMIMKKENHRSRRSKSIAIQTDNEPGEVYPEFEHNPSDTILYPSTVITYPSAASSPIDILSLSNPLSLQSSFSKTDKFLPSHPSTDDSSSSADDDYRTISSTPFLFKLLTGELSKDHYQRLDQQMMDKERTKSSLQ